MIFFWSDPHFFHRNVIRLCNRPFSSLEEMHVALIERYNSKISQDDTCIWVGDCFFSKNTEKCKGVLDRLNGKKILVKGNHDFSAQKMLNMGFVSVQENMWITVAGHPVQINHYPFRQSRRVVKDDGSLTWLGKLLGRKPATDMRYLERRPDNNGQYLVHGHTHSKHGFRNQSIHVGVDAHDFYPVSLEEIESYILEREKR